MSTCFRHDDRKARRKCFRCRQVICMDCYYRRDHHIFCGSDCYLRFKVGDLKNAASLMGQRKIPLALFVVIFALFLAPIGFILLRASNELEGAPVLFRSFQQQPRAVAALITAIEEGEKTMTVAGKATPGAIIFLLRNGASVTSGIAASDGQFRFQLDLDSGAATYSVAAASPATLAAFDLKPAKRTRSASRPPYEIAALRDSVRSNQARFVESYTRGPSEEAKLVLSFDAGSSDRGAQEILATLREHGIRTTVFLTGQFIEKFPEVVRQIVADGHEIGNHMYSHPHLTSFARSRRQTTLPTMTRERFQDELRRTEDLFRQVTGQELARFWRAPFGEENSEIRGWASELGYLHVGWTRGRRYNLDSLDWIVDRRSPNYLSPDALTHRLLNFDAANGTTLNGGIILMHLGTDRGEDERLDRALPLMIQKFQARGFRFVKVSEMKGIETSAS